MAGKDIIIMSAKELNRVSVIQNLADGKITQIDAANITGLSTRQIRRLLTDVRTQGIIALVHRSRGKPSHAAKELTLKDKILTLCKTTYSGFGPTLASEMIEERDNLYIHPETLRLWFIEAGIEYNKRKSKQHRSWRLRKEHAGQMLQMDGSHHKWFRGIDREYVLMGYVDDARGRVFGHFYEYEGIMPAMDSFKRYIKHYGIPQSVYLDKHSTYKSTKKLSLDDELNNQKSLTQFARALSELGVDIIYANSPQAKGRVERSFKTHQDRLIKQMSLEGIKTIKDANRFLHSYYIPKHNRKFSVKAKNKADLHTPIPKSIDLDRVFSVKSKATLRNDFTIQHNNKFYQILDTTRAREVTLEERLNGKLYIYDKNTQLEYKLIDKRPQKPKTIYQPRKPRYVPPKDNPYRKQFKGFFRKTA